MLIQADDSDVKQSLAEYREYIASETQADAIESSASVPDGVKAVSIGNAKVFIWIAKVSK